MSGNPHRPVLVDTSVIARTSQPSVASALTRIQEDRRLVLAPPIILELGMMAVSLKALDSLRAELERLPCLPLTPESGRRALDLQRDLWAGGKVRAAGAFDTLVAAIALEHRAAVLHYDRDFEHLASVCPGLEALWVVPAGSID
jgi:predicted nucleic acid-binding protein